MEKKKNFGGSRNRKWPQWWRGGEISTVRRETDSRKTQTRRKYVGKANVYIAWPKESVRMNFILVNLPRPIFLPVFFFGKHPKRVFFRAILWKSNTIALLLYLLTRATRLENSCVFYWLLAREFQYFLMSEKYFSAPVLK